MTNYLCDRDVIILYFKNDEKIGHQTKINFPKLVYMREMETNIQRGAGIKKERQGSKRLSQRGTETKNHIPTLIKFMVRPW